MFNSDMRMWSEAPPRDQQQGSFTPQEFFSEEAADTAAWSQVGGSVVVLQTINRRCCTITEKAPTRAFFWLKAPTSTFTFKTLLSHYYAKQMLTQGK